MQARDKGKGRAGDATGAQRSSLPTPASEGSDAARGQKRKRTAPTDDLEEEDDELNEEELRFNRYFDPNQDPEVRRDIKRKSRALEREFQGKSFNHRFTTPSNQLLRASR
jgi:non-structural maintenance of chromosomes element 4